MSAAAEQSGTHAAQMDRTYAFQRHIYDLTRKYYLLGRDRLIQQLSVPDGGHALEIGCGTARNLVRAARRYPLAHFHGLDISDEMLRSAHKALCQAGLAERVSLSRGDAETFDSTALFSRDSFDRIFFSYTLSMIPGWERALAHSCTLLAPGGELHVIDFGQQKHLPGWCSVALKAWLARFHVTPRTEMFDIAADLAARHGFTMQSHSLYRDYARAVTLKKP